MSTTSEENLSNSRSASEREKNSYLKEDNRGLRWPVQDEAALDEGPAVAPGKNRGDAPGAGVVRRQPRSDQSRVRAFQLHPACMT